jgi:hypothetical protein
VGKVGVTRADQRRFELDLRRGVGVAREFVRDLQRLRRAITERHDLAGNYPQLDVVGDGLLGHPLEPFAGLAQLALLGEADVEAHPG